jgi:hypothetical protein
MGGIEEIIGRVRRELDGELRDRLRQALAEQPRDWLVEELLDQVLTPNVPRQRAPDPDSPQERAARLERIGAWQLDLRVLADTIERFRPLSRERLEAGGCLIRPSPKGTGLIGPERRSPAGAALLLEAKDLLYALLFCGEEEGVRLMRIERELLTLTVPRIKAHSLAFVRRAVDDLDTDDLWRDPERVCDDERAPNTLIQIEYGEIAEELVGNGIAACLKLINNLEVNEQVLYARMENIEENALP